MPSNGDKMNIQAQNRSRRTITLGVGLIALIAVALLLVDQHQQTSATAGGPEMRMGVTNPAGVCIDTTCQLELRQTFKLAVEVVVAPGTGYTAAQTYIDFGSDLTYNFGQSAADDEFVWPGCEGLTAVKGHIVTKLNDLGTPIADPTNPDRVLVNTSSEVVSHACASGVLPPLPVSSYTGIIVEVDVVCSAADTLTEVFLRSSADPLTGTRARTVGSAFSFLEPVPPFGNQTDTPAKVSNLIIICGEPPTPTPTSTITPGGPTLTPVPTSTPTPAGTATPTPTPTITPGGPTETPTAGPDQDTPTPTPVPHPCGDVSGDGVVDSQDALWVLWLATGVINFVPFFEDLDGDGVTGPIDALLILQIAANLFICR